MLDRKVFLILVALDGLLHVVAREKAGDALHHTLPPTVVVLLQDIDDLPLLEGQLVLLVSVVVVDSDDLLQVVLGHPAREGQVLGHHHSGQVPGGAKVSCVLMVCVPVQQTLSGPASRPGNDLWLLLLLAPRAHTGAAALSAVGGSSTSLAAVAALPEGRREGIKE